ncbi:uncharacterized protein [Haliotis asinina]|uniref:uncharacterized protein isoform X1 n=1 Tax=Haliotis asinina TaxID=109174 RepID=UPI003532183D
MATLRLNSTMTTLETDAVPEPNFKALILKIALNLGVDDLESLKYMFKDLLAPNKINDAVSMFTHLEEKRLIQQGKTSLLTQAFLRIGRNDLLQHLQGTDHKDLMRDKERFPDGTVSDFRLVLFGIAQNLAPDEVETAKFYFGDMIGKQKRGKIKNAFDLLTILEQQRPDDFIEKLKSFLTQIERNDILQDLPDYKASAGASRMPRRFVQKVPENAGHPVEAPKSCSAAPPGSDGWNARPAGLFPGSLGKANQGMDVEKACDMDLINQAAGSVCSIGTNGTGFRVGDNCIMTAAHVLNLALGIPQEQMQSILKIGRASLFNYVQQKLNLAGLQAYFTHGRNGTKCFELTTLRFFDVHLDTAIVELAPSADGNPFPQAFTRFLKDYKGRFSLLGHVGDLILYREHNCYTITDREAFQEMKRELLNKGILPKHLEVYDGFGKDSSFLQFHCSLRHGASGSPGVVVSHGEVCVVTMLQAGHPENPFDIPLDPTLCVEVGVSVTGIDEHMKDTDQQLHRDIFGTD